MIWAGVAVFSFTTLQEINRQRRIKELISCVVKVTAIRRIFIFLFLFFLSLFHYLITFGKRERKRKRKDSSDAVGCCHLSLVSSPSNLLCDEDNQRQVTANSFQALIINFEEVYVSRLTWDVITSSKSWCNWVRGRTPPGTLHYDSIFIFTI